MRALSGSPPRRSLVVDGGRANGYAVRALLLHSLGALEEASLKELSLDSRCPYSGKLQLLMLPFASIYPLIVVIHTLKFLILPIIVESLIGMNSEPGIHLFCFGSGMHTFIRFVYAAARETLSLHEGQPITETRRCPAAAVCSPRALVVLHFTNNKLDLQSLY